MRLLYSLIFYLATPLVLLHLVIRGLKDSAYLRGWRERFGYSRTQGLQGGIVIHAASVGELNAAEPLIRALLSRNRALPITVTTFTPTGSQRVHELFDNQVSHGFVPFDLPGAVRRFLNRTRPALLIVMETELWPNLYCQAARRDIPIVLANARVSVKSFARYQRFAELTRMTLEQVTQVAAQSDSDLQRFVSLGVSPERVFCSGNLKFDLQLPAGLMEQAAALRQTWGQERPVLVAASTHAADDKVVLDAFSRMIETIPSALLIIAPRHPERFDETVSLAKARGFRTSRFSNSAGSSPQHQCHVIDAMGELLTYYASCDIAFIGGSFGTVGGHNALEAAGLAKPVLFGPNMQNFAEISRLLQTAGAAVTVKDSDDLAQTAVALLQADQRRMAMGQAGYRLVEENKGALERTLAVINPLLLPVKPADKPGSKS